MVDLDDVVVAVVVVDVCGSGSVRRPHGISIRETRCVSFRRARRDRRAISALTWYVGAPKAISHGECK